MHQIVSDFVTPNTFFPAYNKGERIWIQILLHGITG